MSVDTLWALLPRQTRCRLRGHQWSWVNRVYRDGFVHDAGYRECTWCQIRMAA